MWEDQEKYYKLACNHTGIDRPVFQHFDIPDDYLFMEKVEKEFGIKHVGNFRSDVCEFGFERAIQNNNPCKFTGVISNLS